MFVKKYTYDDVLLIPQFSKILPRETNLRTKFSKNIILEIPIVSAAMDTVTEAEMVLAIGELGGIGVIHKNFSIKEQIDEVLKVKNHNKNSCKTNNKKPILVAAAIGVTRQDINRCEQLITNGVNAIVIDTAHADSSKVISFIKEIQKFKNANTPFDIVVGNIATASACKRILDCEIDGIKIGIGPGSICTTRIIAGIGNPQLSAIIECSEIAKEYNIPLIADGGIKHSGDIVKALAAGANTVMLGSLISGTKETPGSILERNGQKFKAYRGMGSRSAMVKGSKDRYFQDDIDDCSKLTPEGIEALVPYKGELKNILQTIIGGICAGLGYTGNRNIEELQTFHQFIEITAAGLKESHPHSVTMNDHYNDW